MLRPENLFGLASTLPTNPAVFTFSGGGATINPPTLVGGGFPGGKFSLTVTFKPVTSPPVGYLCK